MDDTVSVFELAPRNTGLSFALSLSLSLSLYLFIRIMSLNE